MSLSFPPSPSVGQGYQQFKWDGAKWVPNPAAVSGIVASYNGRSGVVVPQTGDETSGNRVLLTSVDIGTPVATVDFFSGFDGTYDLLELDIYDVTVATDSSSYPLLRCSQDGSTFDTGGNYNYQYIYSAAGAAPGPGGLTGSAAMLMGNSLGALGQYANRLHIKFQRSATGRATAIWQLHLTNGTSFYTVTGSGSYTAGGATPVPVKGLRFGNNGGYNFTRGSFRLFGIKK